MNPGEVERVLKMSPQVREAVVLGLPASARGEEVVACIEGDVNEADLRMLCASNLASLAGPETMVFLRRNSAECAGKN